MIQAVIFDMDGLLVDSEPCWDRARKELARQVGKQWTETDHFAVMGVSSYAWSSYMIERLELNMSIEQVQMEIVSRLISFYEQKIPFMPGAIRAVQLSNANWITGLASGSHPDLIKIVVNHKYLAGCFKAILSSDSVKAGKPEPDVYIETAHQLGVNPVNCVCLEDSANGLIAGKKAKMKVIAVPNPSFPLSQEQLLIADVVLNSLEEFTPKIIETL